MSWRPAAGALCALLVLHGGASAGPAPYYDDLCIPSSLDGQFGGHASATCYASRLTGVEEVSAVAEQGDGSPVPIFGVSHPGATSYAYMGELMPDVPGRYPVSATVEDVWWTATVSAQGQYAQAPIASVTANVICTGPCIFDLAPEGQTFAQLASCSGASKSCDGSVDRIEFNGVLTVLPGSLILGPPLAQVVLSAGAYLYGGGGSARAQAGLVVADITIGSA